MITYSELYEALRKERYSEQLQSMSAKFVKDVAEYLEGKKQASGASNEDSKAASGISGVSGGESVFLDDEMKSKKQFENAVSMFKELMLRRKKKILNLVFIAAETGLSKRDFENMLLFEKALFEKIIRLVESSDKELNRIMKGGAEEAAKHSLIVFKESAEEFLDLEGNKTGPFEKGDIASLNPEIAKILVSSGKADYLEGEERG